MIQWNRMLLDRWIAKGYSEFTDAKIPDLRDEFPQGEHWLADYFLNSVLGPGFAGEARSVITNSIIRAHRAFRAYHSAKDSTDRFLSSRNPDEPFVAAYHDALFHWEVFVLQVSICIDLTNRINGEFTGGKPTVYKRGDKSPEERCAKLANRIKHFSSDMFGKEPLKSSANHSFEAKSHNVKLPIRLKNHGLVSDRGDILTYLEASKILRDISRDADDLQNPHGLKKSSREGI